MILGQVDQPVKTLLFDIPALINPIPFFNFLRDNLLQYLVIMHTQAAKDSEPSRSSLEVEFPEGLETVVHDVN